MSTTRKRKQMPQVIESGVAYLALKAAQKLYGKAPAVLQAAEFVRVQEMARERYELESRVLATPEACDATVPPATLQAALQEIRGRYGKGKEFVADLANNGMDEAEFAEALERELRVEAVLEKIGTRAAAVSDIDVELYYRYHPDQFRRPETRQARHILVTVNEDFAENTRQAAQQRIAEISARLHKEPGRFEEQALKHSECPTALDGGKLGDLLRGKLFPELDRALFGMEAGEVSGVLESELGFHILRCDAITESGVLRFSEAKQHIRRLLEQKRKRVCQQAWVKKLLGEK